MPARKQFFASITKPSLQAIFKVGICSGKEPRIYSLSPQEVLLITYIPGRQEILQAILIFSILILISLASKVAQNIYDNLLSKSWNPARNPACNLIF